MFSPARCILPVVCAAASTCYASGTVKEIRVMPQVGVKINGFDEVQPIFNANVNGSSRGEAIELVRDIRLNGARAFLWTPFSKVKAPMTPWAAKQYKGQPVSKEEALDAWDKWYSQDFDKSVEEVISRGVESKGSQQYQLKLFKEWGLTGNLIFHTQVDGSADRHPEGVNRYYGAYIDAIRRHAPWLNVDFIQVTNEPNYPWWSGQFKSTKESVDTWIRVFNRLDSFLREKYPETRLIGPCTASSEAFSWGGFKNWTRPVLRDVKHPMEFFNYHLYDVGAYSHLAWMEMFQAEAESYSRPRPQAVVTEINYELGNKDAEGNRFLWFAQHIFTALDNPDKFSALSYHLLAYPNGFNHAYIIMEKDGKFIPTGPYWLYWAMSSVRGRYLYVDTNNSAVRAFACSPAPKQLLACLFNDGVKEQVAGLASGLPGTAGVEKVIKRIAYPVGQAVKHQEEDITRNPDALSRLVLPPGAICTVNWVLHDELPAPEKTVCERGYYSRTVASSFNDDLAASVSVDKLPGEDENAFLRLGVYNDDPLFAKGLTVQFNGHEMPIFWNQAPEELTVDNRTAYWLSLPLEDTWVKKDNVVKLLCPGASYRLMFISVVLRQYPSAEIAKRMMEGIKDNQVKEIKATVENIGPIMFGEARELVVTVFNPSPSPRQFKLNFDVPEDLVLKGVDIPQSVSVQGSESVSFKRGIICETPPDGVVEGKVAVRIASPGMLEKELSSIVTVYPELNATKTNEPVNLNPDQELWRDVKPIVFEATGIKTSTELRWDENFLYARIAVHGDFQPQASDSIGGFWIKDSIEFFIDLNNSKGRMYGKDDRQFFVCPVGLEGAVEPLRGHVVREQRGDFVEVVDTISEPRIQASSRLEKEGGYSMVCAIPWKIISPDFKPVKGTRIGLDVAMNHARSTDNIALHTSIIGLKGKPYLRPDKWGILTLK
ncbi:MAG: hypothetical protein JW808_03620 [Victivallales bacterium]|nr:hypothetical protein [Victivallales bacterium]